MGLTRPSQLELDCHVPEERGARSTAKCSTLTGGPKAKPVNSLLCSYETIRLVLMQLITPVNVLLCQSLTFELEANTCGLRNSLYVATKQNEIVSTVLQHEPCKSLNMQISRRHKRWSLIFSCKQSSFLASVFL